MEASALTHASRSGLLARRSPLLRLTGDERLVAMIRQGHARAFEVLFDRYQARLLAFCRHMLGSTEDAEDVLQEVFANAHTAMVADKRPINVRPWLYRIARNRCLNHLRKPVPEGQDTMDVHPHENGTTTAERVQTREDFRALLVDVGELPETQRTALLLREIEALAYEEIASAMTTTVPAVKSLLVRARMSLAEATQSRLLTCGDVRLELAEAAEGLRKASGPVRQHVRRCDPCRHYRAQLRSNGKALAALAPAGLLVWLHKALGIKLGTSSSAGGAGAAGGSGAAAGGVAAAGGSAAFGGAAAGGGALAGGVGGALGAKAAAGVATAALLTAGAVEVNKIYSGERDGEGSAAALRPAEPKHQGDVAAQRHAGQGTGGVAAARREPAPIEAKVTPVPAEDEVPAPPHHGVIGSAANGSGADGGVPASGSGTATGVVAVVYVPPDSPSEEPPAEEPPPEEPPPEEPPPGGPPPEDPPPPGA